MWIDVERTLADDEAILFGGMTLARITGIPALFHRVEVGGNTRISAPFFQRSSPNLLLPATAHHEAEMVVHFNAKARAAYNDELTGTGVISVAPHNRRDYERRLAKELWHVERLSKPSRKNSSENGSEPRGRPASMTSPVNGFPSMRNTYASPERDARGGGGYDRSRDADRGSDRWSDRRCNDRSDNRKGDRGRWSDRSGDRRGDRSRGDRRSEQRYSKDSPRNSNESTYGEQRRYGGSAYRDHDHERPRSHRDYYD